MNLLVCIMWDTQLNLTTATNIKFIANICHGSFKSIKDVTTPFKVKLVSYQLIKE